MSDGRTEEAAWYSLAVGAFARDRRLSDDDDEARSVARRKSCEQGILQPIYSQATKKMMRRPRPGHRVFDILERSHERSHELVA